MTTSRIIAAFALAAASLFVNAQDAVKESVPAPAPAIPANLENSVVKVFATLRRPDPFKPWSKA